MSANRHRLLEGQPVSGPELDMFEAAVAWLKSGPRRCDMGQMPPDEAAAVEWLFALGSGDSGKSGFERLHEGLTRLATDPVIAAHPASRKLAAWLCTMVRGMIESTPTYRCPVVADAASWLGPSVTLATQRARGRTAVDKRHERSRAAKKWALEQWRQAQKQGEDDAGGFAEIMVKRIKQEFDLPLKAPTIRGWFVKAAADLPVDRAIYR